MIAETYWELIRNLDHWAFEITLILIFDVILAGILYPLFRKWLVAHDIRHHGHSCEDDHEERKN